MAYPALGENYGPGSPIDIADQTKLWGDTDRTNGRLLKNVDGRVPVLRQSFSRIVVAPSSPIFESGTIPWGNALWRDIGAMPTKPNTLHAAKPTKGTLAGVLPFEQGWQAGHPVQPYGLPVYGKSDYVGFGYVGYKFAMASATVGADYMAYIAGDASKDVGTVRTTYAEWMTAYAAAADGAQLGLFFVNTNGFPIVSVVPAASISNPALAGATFGGFAKAFEPENRLVFFLVGGR